MGKGILYIIWEERGGARGTRWEKGFYILYWKKGAEQEGQGGKRDSIYHMGRKGRSKRDQLGKGILYIIWEERGGARGTRWEKGFYISYGKKGEEQEGPGRKRDSIYHYGKKGEEQEGPGGKRDSIIILYGKKGEEQEGPGGKRDSIHYMGRKGRSKRDQVGKGILYIIWEERGGTRGTRWENGFYISYGKKGEKQEGPGEKRDSIYYMGRKGRSKRDQVGKGILYIIWEERGGTRGTRWEKGFYISYGKKGEKQEGPGEKRDSIYYMGRKGRSKKGRSKRDQVRKGIRHIILEERGGARGTRWKKGFYISYGKKGEEQEGPGGKRDSMGTKGRIKRDQVGKWILYIIWEERGGARGTRWEKGFYISDGKKGEKQEGPGEKGILYIIWEERGGSGRNRDSVEGKREGEGPYYIGRKGRSKRDQVGIGTLWKGSVRVRDQVGRGVRLEGRGGPRGTK